MKSVVWVLQTNSVKYSVDHFILKPKLIQFPNCCFRHDTFDYSSDLKSKTQWMQTKEVNLTKFHSIIMIDYWTKLLQENRVYATEIQWSPM